MRQCLYRYIYRLKHNYIYIYIYIRGSLYKFPDFFVWAILKGWNIRLCQGSICNIMFTTLNLDKGILKNKRCV